MVGRRTLTMKTPNEDAFTWLVAAFRLNWLDALSFMHDEDGEDCVSAVAVDDFHSAPEDLRNRWVEAGGTI